MAVVNFGSINIDHIYSVPHFVTPGETLSSSGYKSVLGGKGANQSIACALAGASVMHVGAIHTNDNSFLKLIESAGVDCQFVNQQSEVATGHAIIQVNSDGENAIVLFAGANNSLSEAQIDAALNNTKTNDWILLQNETNAIEEIIEKAAAKGLSIAFNPAPMRPNTASLPLDKVSLLFVNEVEAMQLSQTQTVEEAISALSNNYPNTKVVLTLGKAGVSYLYKGQHTKIDGYKVNAVDTTAAGDTFTGYFLANYIDSLSNDNNDPTEALKKACAAAALCVTKEGAAPSIPSAAELANFIQQHSTNA